MISVGRGLTILTLLSGLLLAGCSISRVPFHPAPGFVFTNVDAPLTLDLRGQSRGTKMGTSSAYFVGFPLLPVLSVGIGDASLEAAMAEGGLTRVHYADYHQFQILGVFGNFEIRAYGE
ncbi:MAG: TRL domain-containing protein [Planctomycetota bacterium]